MSTLYQSLAIILPQACAFSFLLLMLILCKGQICSGQRSRLHLQFGSLWSLSSLGLVSMIASGTPSLAAIILLSLSVIAGWILSIKALRLEGKRIFKRAYWWLSGAPLLVVVGLMSVVHYPALLASFIAALAITHWVMLKAAHRLNSFDRLLPLTALVFFILSLGLYISQMWGIESPVLIGALQTKFIYVVAFSAIGMLLWLLPAFRQMEPTAAQLGATSLSLVIAAIKVTELQFMLH